MRKGILVLFRYVVTEMRACKHRLYNDAIQIAQCVVGLM